MLAVILPACSPAFSVNEDTLAPKVESTKIYAADGTLITVLKQEENRDIIAIEDIPKHVRDAVVAVEDARFYTHRGIDLKAILRATYSNANSGRVIEGGSTITQQLVRNSISDVGRERTLERKLKEAQYAYNVDKTFSKDKILELYLNTVYFGAGAYGVQTAAQTYFDKNIDEVSISEGALLAGLVKSPVNYDPRTNPAAALKRRNLVLRRMVTNQFLPSSEAAIASATPIGLADKHQTETYAAPYFVDYITREIQRSDEFSALGETESERGNKLFRGGLRIRTTLDLRAQKAAEEAIGKVLDHPDQDPSASLVAIDPKDGHIKALVGGRDYFATSDRDPCVLAGAINADGSPKLCAKVNLALGQAGGGAGRQPGSAFKPFVLATALAKGKKLTDTYPATSCVDIPKADAGHNWHVCNYEEQAFGQVTIREATYKSINTVYAPLIMEVGPRDVVNTAERMGICETTRPLLPASRECRLQAVPSAALGSNVVSPLDMASAFTAFANGGVHNKPVSITTIEDARGNILWKAEPHKVQVLNPGIAYLTNTALQDVINIGTASRSGKIGRPAFGKTGTAQEWRDAWFIGGAGTDLVAAVALHWPDGEIEMKPSCDGRRTGYSVVKDSQGQPLALPPECRATRIRVTGGSWPTQIWQLFMLNALQGIPASSFPVPEVEVVTVEVDSSRGCLPNPYTPTELIQKQTFIKGTEPTQLCAEPTGPSGTTIPSVIGYPEATALDLLNKAGFSVTEQQEPSTLYPPGRVTRQDPPAQSSVNVGSAVTIWISTASTSKVVPDVVNMGQADARAKLENEGFAVTIDPLAGCEGKTGNECTVRDQSPDGGKKAPAGSTVTIQVGPKP